MTKQDLTYSKQPMAAIAPHLRRLKEKNYQVLKSNISQNPKSGKTWFQLGDCCRALGYLTESAYAYRQSEKLGFEVDFSIHMSQILEQVNKPIQIKNEPLFTPSPFQLFDNFLPNRQIKDVWTLYKNNAIEFKPSTVGSSGQETVDQVTRSSVLTDLKQLKEIDFFINALSPILSSCYTQFGICFPEKEHLLVQLTSHLNGDFYGLHNDAGETAPGRKLSYVYYFHSQPKAFTGGDLHLYDTNEKDEKCGNSYTCITPLHNRLIVFPSQFFHQVTTVQLEDNLDANGRHSINGWHSDTNQIT